MQMSQVPRQVLMKCHKSQGEEALFSGGSARGSALSKEQVKINWTGQVDAHNSRWSGLEELLNEMLPHHVQCNLNLH